MEFGLAFSYPFKDAEWFKKLIVIGLISLIPVIGQMVLLGWALEAARRVITQHPVLLPEVDFGGQLGKGFKAWVVQLVYSIPMLILSAPLYIAPLALGSMDSDTAGTVMAVLSICCSGIILIYGIAMALVIPAALGKLAVDDSLGAAFKVGAVFGLVRSAPVAYLLVFLGSIVASFIASLGSIACGIGVLVTMPYALAIMGNLYGQAYVQGSAAKAV